MVTATKISTNKASKVCKQLSEEGIDIPKPSQSAIYKAIFKEAEKLKKEMIDKLHTEEWSIHFDGKHVEENECQVVVLKNEKTEIRLGALCLKDEYNLWHSINMIVADTTSVNNGKKLGVVVRLQQKFADKGISKPQFISYQHHILDRILCLVMDEELGGNTRSPNIKYPFMSKLMKNYEELKTSFKNGTEQIHDKSGWRDDMKFLYHLTCVFHFFDEKGYFPLFNFQKIPNINSARWNSIAILAIFTYILLPAERKTLEKICRFISYSWADYWFTEQNMMKRVSQTWLIY